VPKAKTPAKSSKKAKSVALIKPKPMKKLWAKTPFNQPVALVIAFGIILIGTIAFGTQATSNPTIGPDTSNFQNYLNASEAYSQGSRFQIMKATEGLDFEDYRFGTSLADAKKGGIIPGAYHFLHRGSGAAQADYFINYVKKYNGNSTKGVMYMLDVESYGSTYPTYQDVLDFTNRFKQLVPGRTLIIYTGLWFWGDAHSYGYLGDPAAPSGTVLDVSIYITCTGSAADVLKCVTPPGGPGEPYAANPIKGWPSYYIRQYSDNATFANINADANVTYDGLTSLKNLAGILPPATPKPTPTPTPKPSPTPSKSATPKPSASPSKSPTPKPSSTPKPTPAPTNPYACSTHPTLSKGASGTCVERVQWFLNHKGSAGLTIDGSFGPGTYSAIRTWQSHHNLSVDGVVGQLTWSSLEGTKITQTANPYACSSHPTLSEGASGTCVERVQWFLNNKGGAGLPIDGSFGPKTYAAVRTWQSDHGLTVDGVVGSLTWSTLEP